MPLKEKKIVTKLIDLNGYLTYNRGFDGTVNTVPTKEDLFEFSYDEYKIGKLREEITGVVEAYSDRNRLLITSPTIKGIHHVVWGCCESLKQSATRKIYVVFSTIEAPICSSGELICNGMLNQDVTDWVKILKEDIKLNVRVVADNEKRDLIAQSGTNYIINNVIPPIVEIDYEDKKYDKAGFRCLIALQALRVCKYIMRHKNRTFSNLPNNLSASEFFNKYKTDNNKFVLLKYLMQGNQLNIASVGGWFVNAFLKSNENIYKLLSGDDPIKGSQLNSLFISSTPFSLYYTDGINRWKRNTHPITINYKSYKEIFSDDEICRKFLDLYTVIYTERDVSENNKAQDELVQLITTNL